MKNFYARLKFPELNKKISKIWTLLKFYFANRDRISLIISLSLLDILEVFVLSIQGPNPIKNVLYGRSNL